MSQIPNKKIFLATKIPVYLPRPPFYKKRKMEIVRIWHKLPNINEVCSKL